MKCITCNFYTTESGSCRKNPPLKTGFPAVDRGAWCGCWERSSKLEEEFYKNYESEEKPGLFGLYWPGFTNWDSDFAFSDYLKQIESDI